MRELDDNQWNLDSLATEALREFIADIVAEVGSAEILNDCNDPRVDDLDDEDWDKVVDLIETAVVVVEVGWRV